MDYSGYNEEFLYNKIHTGDVVKFKYIYEPWSNHSLSSSLQVGNVSNNTKQILFGVVVGHKKDNYKSDLLIAINTSTKSIDFNSEINKNIDADDPNIYWVSYTSIIQWIPYNFLSSLTLRVVLKNMWKNLIFREIKTVKTKKIEAVHYKYINGDGLSRTRIFNNLDIALRLVPRKYHRNIQTSYEDYYGFSTDAVVQPSDPYDDKEIFFSKKCHTEINMETGLFQNERSTNKYPPVRGQYICGLVENGEKGLFFRKWFLCSPQFLILWIMICYPSSPALKYRNSSGLKTKTLPMLYKDLSTKHYQVDYSLSIKERSDSYKVTNFEKSSIYSPDTYVNIAKTIFENKNYLEKLYDGSEIRHTFYNNVMWMKNYIDVNC